MVYATIFSNGYMFASEAQSASEHSNDFTRRTMGEKPLSEFVDSQKFNTEKQAVNYARENGYLRI